MCVCFCFTNISSAQPHCLISVHTLHVQTRWRVIVTSPCSCHWTVCLQRGSQSQVPQSWAWASYVTLLCPRSFSGKQGWYCVYLSVWAGWGGQLTRAKRFHSLSQNNAMGCVHTQQLKQMWKKTVVVSLEAKLLNWWVRLSWGLSIIYHPVFDFLKNNHRLWKKFCFSLIIKQLKKGRILKSIRNFFFF